MRNISHRKGEGWSGPEGTICAKALRHRSAGGFKT